MQILLCALARCTLLQQYLSELLVAPEQEYDCQTNESVLATAWSKSMIRSSASSSPILHVRCSRCC